MIRLGEVGTKILRVTGWVMFVGLVVAAVFGEWMLGVQLGLIAAACKGALIWEGLDRGDSRTDFDLVDDGG